MSDSNNKLEQATDIVKSIPEFMEAITEVLQTPWGWLFLSVIMFWLLINKDLSNFFNFFKREERHRLEKMESYVSNKAAADENALGVIKDLRDAYYFKAATGIYAESLFRDCLINLHKATSHNINWTQIRRALPYIDAYPDKHISIRDMNSWEKFGHYYNLIVGFMFLFFTVVIFFAFMLDDPKTLTNIFVGTGSSLACAIFSLFVFAQNWSYTSARDIRRELETKHLQQENSAE